MCTLVPVLRYAPSISLQSLLKLGKTNEKYTIHNKDGWTGKNFSFKRRMAEASYFQAVHHGVTKQWHPACSRSRRRWKRSISRLISSLTDFQSRRKMGSAWYPLPCNVSLFSLYRKKNPHSIYLVPSLKVNWISLPRTFINTDFSGMNYNFHLDGFINRC